MLDQFPHFDILLLFFSEVEVNTYRTSQTNPLIYTLDIHVFLCVWLYFMAIDCDFIERCQLVEDFCFWCRVLFLFLFF